jgi:hypothetical protein
MHISGCFDLFQNARVYEDIFNINIIFIALKDWQKSFTVPVYLIIALEIQYMSVMQIFLLSLELALQQKYT